MNSIYVDWENNIICDGHLLNMHDDSYDIYEVFVEDDVFKFKTLPSCLVPSSGNLSQLKSDCIEILGFKNEFPVLYK